MLKFKYRQTYFKELKLQNIFGVSIMAMPKGYEGKLIIGENEWCG